MCLGGGIVFKTISNLYVLYFGSEGIFSVVSYEKVEQKGEEIGNTFFPVVDFYGINITVYSAKIGASKKWRIGEDIKLSWTSRDTKKIYIKDDYHVGILFFELLIEFILFFLAIKYLFSDASHNIIFTG
jgi:hypothetical protein